MKSLRRLQELSDPEAFRLLVWSLLTVLLTAVLVRTKSLPALLNRLAQPSHTRISREAQRQPDIRQIQRIWRYSHVIVTTLLCSRRPCLLRSLVVYRYGCRYGLPISIHFGVRSGMDGLEGHSWVTLHGRPLCESEEGVRSYVAVYSYPEDPSETGMNQVPAAERTHESHHGKREDTVHEAHPHEAQATAGYYGAIDELTLGSRKD